LFKINFRKPGIRRVLLCLGALAGATPLGAQTGVSAADIAKTIVDLQPFRETQTMDIEGVGPKRATLVNLNPAVNVWYLLTLTGAQQNQSTAYHLENLAPDTQRLGLSKGFPNGLVVTGGRSDFNCDLWGHDTAKELAAARKSGQSYAPLCQGRLYLRNQTKGHRTSLETVTDFLRDHVAGGEKIVVLVRDTLYRDRYLDRPALKPGAESDRQAPTRSEGWPRPARIDPKYERQVIVLTNLGIQIAGAEANGVTPGHWYQADGQPGVYVSVIRPNLIAPAVFGDHRNLVKPLDTVEADAVVYLIAFDLYRFELGFALGTEHPRVDWSERTPETSRRKQEPGPDGIGSVAPLVSTGLINPGDAARTAATFIGGFKRSHGAFKWGELAQKNQGSHYGFMENGVVFSTLQPGLATIFVFDDGTVEVKTWEESDNAKLARIKHARQNGVPIIASGGGDGSLPVPGSLVGQWGPGNWSGSADQKLRTVRAGICLLEYEKKRFIVYAYFSSATPSAMARVFQAYGCRYAMLLDMNALEHTYLAIYRREASNFLIEHLIPGMNQLDKTVAGQYVPRFLGYADNRDFFYVMRREDTAAP